MDLTGKTLPELRALEAEISKAIKQKRKQEMAAAKQQIQEIAERVGVSVDELVNPIHRRKTGPAPVKYRHPENPEQQWTGRGRTPRWLANALAQGRDLAEFAVA